MKKNNQLQFLTWAMITWALVPWLTGCSDTISGNIKTSGLFTQYSVTSTGSNQVQCQAIFQVGGGTGTYVILDSGDSVTCNGQQMSYTQDLFNQIIYTTKVPVSVSGNYTLTLNRSSEGTYNSTVILPPSFQILSPANGASFKKGGSLPVSWTPNTNSKTTMSVYLSYSLNTPASSSFYEYATDPSSPETGNAVFPSQDTQVNPPVPGTWPATLTFTRSLSGSMDPSLAGNIYSQQVLNLSVNLVD